MQREYRTVAAAASAQFEERRSRFIGQIAPVCTGEQALAFLEQVRAQHREATHNVYAYILRENNTVRFSDDGEPSGTAGRPVLEVLQREGLTDIAVVVTRYFGGILLGAGGLVRAYAEGAASAVRAAQLVTMKPACELLLDLNYTLYGRVQALLPEYGAITRSAEFGAGVTLCLLLESIRLPAFAKALSELSAGAVQPVVKGENFYPF